MGQLKRRKGGRHKAMAESSTTDKAKPMVGHFSKLPKQTILFLIIFVALGVGITGYAIFHPRSDNLSPLVPRVSDLSESSAKQVYAAFTAIVKAKDQSAADDITTDYFKMIQKTAFQSTDGKWLSAKVPDGRNIMSIIDALPVITTSTSFSQQGYVTTDGKTKGLSLRYALDDATIKKLSLTGTSAHNQFLVSFIVAKNRLIVDAATLFDPDPGPSQAIQTNTSPQQNLSSVQDSAAKAGLKK
jgi:hypothetical protein